MTTLRVRRLIPFLAASTMAAALALAQQPAQPVQASNQSPKAPATQTTASSTSPTAPSAQKPAADTSADGATKVTASAQKADGSDAQLIRDARNAGFKPQMIRGTQMFCRTAIELGSSFPVRTCYSADQVKIKIHEYQEQRNQLEQMHEVGQPP